MPLFHSHIDKMLVHFLNIFFHFIYLHNEIILANLLDPSEIRLLFASKQLEDTDKLSDHGIKDKSTLMSVLRLHGGWTHPMDSLLTPCHQDGYGSTMLYYGRL